MKKFILPAIAFLFVFASCTKEVTKVVHDAQGIVYEIHPEDWVAVKGDSTVLYAYLEVPELTPAIFDHGAVLVYLSFADGEYEALPEVINFKSYTARHYDDGFVKIAVRDIDGYIVLPPDGLLLAKIVLISAEKIALHPNVDLQDYEQVRQVFHLP